MEISLHRWIKVSLFNLAIVAAIGTLLRYKIAYSLPWLDQKHLLHGHSHFAFTGWVSQLLMALLVYALGRQSGQNAFIRYRFLLLANLFTAYGMLIAFPLQGYAPASIACSTASIFVSYIFAVRYWRDLNALPVQRPAFAWFRAALIFNAISSLGAFSLAYMMANRIVHQDWYLGAVYFFLHFQYNGWFFFGCMGLLYLLLQDHLPEKTLRHIFRMFALACVPAYFLSALWMPIPVWVFVLVVAAAFVQVIAWGWLLYLLKGRIGTVMTIPAPGRILFMLAALALTVKLLLQLGSTIPSLSQLAFGFRPIVIGYLHLVLLGVISIFLLAYVFALGMYPFGRALRAGSIIFIGAVILNEMGLMLQGVAAMSYTPVPVINEFLLGMALLLFAGSCLLFIGLKRSR